MEMTHQQIITHLAGIRDGLVKGCECGGSGVRKIAASPLDDALYDRSCPSCAELRGLELCWHKKPTKNMRDNWPIGGPKPIPSCSKCGLSEMQYGDNPDLTTHRQGSKLWIVHVMQVLGEWEGFVEWHVKKHTQGVLRDPWTALNMGVDGEKLVPVIGAYLEGRE